MVRSRLALAPLPALLLAALLTVPAGTSLAGARLVAGEPTVLRPASRDTIDAARLHEHVRTLASDDYEGRGAGTDGGARAQAYVERAFEAAGLRAFDSGFRRPFRFEHPRTGETVEAVNLVGFVPGTRHPDAYIVVTAHFDHLGVRDGVVYNGADDNASGTAALLELARAVAARPPGHSVVFAALDAEEVGLRGARAFLETPPVPAEAIRLNLNLDMVGRSEAGELYAAGTHHYPSLKPALEAVAARSSIRLRFGHDTPGLPPGDDWTGASDHGVFHRAGIPFVYFGVEDHPDYHRPTDDPAGIDPAFHAAAAATVLDALHTLDGQMERLMPE